MFQPLTFKSNIKSSGYNQVSRKLFHPILNKQHNNNTILKKRSSSDLAWKKKEIIKCYWEKEPKQLYSERLENSKNLILQTTGKPTLIMIACNMIVIKQMFQLFIHGIC
ncbi:uncharacterized protein LOC111618933 isoform X2 [Centruroides sculpturatus]|uniref:uncharacterized protein LOC111618933 isoform X2 n=1 Tax=Centruroides sculpturatus TaxID=218467 RepID=UPI000C6DF570|nr:uncharacterized protein LOC111618933 isoform X2 [Centruroides sculpturatus]